MDTSAAPPTGPVLDVRRHGLREAAERLWPVVRPQRRPLVIGCGLIGVAGGLYGVMPLFAKFLLDEAVPQRNLALAAAIAGGFVATHAVRMGLWTLAMWQILLAQEKVTYGLRVAGFGHLQRLSLRFHHRYPSGFLYQSVFGTSINAVGGAMQTILKQLSLYIVALVTSLISCVVLSPSMTLLILLGSVAYVAIARVTGPKIYATTRRSNDAQNGVSDFIIDRLRGMRTVQSLSLEERVEADFAARLWPAQLRALEATRQAFGLSVTTEFAGYVITAAIMVAGAYAIFEGGLSVGDLVAFLAYQATFINIVSTLTNVWGSIAGARAGLDQLLTILGTPSHLQTPPGAEMPGRVGGELRFERVTFGYEPGRPVLQGLDVVVPPGQRVALVGESGGGKTTLANLILRLYDPDEGRVLLDGQDIRTLPLKDYRSLFGMVLQDPYLFNTTIRENLLCARPEATEAELVEALRAARAWDFVRELPFGLDSVVGDSGSGLSGGQRQRIAIARCLLLRSRFVILDEPTSALDAESERGVTEAFESLFAGRTVFVIAHRLSTIRTMDRVLVLRAGRVVQDGSYDELAEVEGPFKRMHQ